MAPIVIAHRTCPRDAAENSLDGIAEATRLGADVVEIDVRRTKDGTPVLLHDRWLLRTTLWPLRLEWIGRIRAARLKLLGGGQLPTLAEALAALGPTLRVAIDVKDAGAGDATVSEVRNQGVERQVLFWSQHEQAVRTAVSQAPELEISLLRDTKTHGEMDNYFADTRDFGARGVSVHWSQVSAQLAARCTSEQLKLYSWCKQKSIEPDKLRLLDGLVTDWPAIGNQAIGNLD